MTALLSYATAYTYYTSWSHCSAYMNIVYKRTSSDICNWHIIFLEHFASGTLPLELHCPF